MGKKFLKFRLRKGWKFLASLMLAMIVFSTIFVMVRADSKVNIVFNTQIVYVEKDRTASSVTAGLTGNDENTSDNIPIPERLEWTTSNSDIVNFVDGGSSSTNYTDLVTGVNPTIHGHFAGKATLTANYYTKQFDDNNMEVQGTKKLLASKSLTAVVPLTTSTTYQGSESLPTIFPIGAQIYITSNASDSNPIVIETTNDTSGTVSNDGVVKLVNQSGNTATLEVVGGGVTTVYVRTRDNPDRQDILTNSFKVSGEIKFNDGTAYANQTGHYIQTASTAPANGIKRFMLLDSTDFVDFAEETVPSNILYPVTSNATFRSGNDKIAKYTDNKVTGVAAGVTTITAGIFANDTQGKEVALTSDTINIVVPFKKMGNQISDMNVGDSIVLSTSASPDSVTWSTTDNKIAQVDPATGTVTAVGAGNVSIYATRTQDELSTVFKQPYQLKYDLTVIDGFGLSTTSNNVNVGDSFDLTALVTNADLDKSPITFTVENQPGANGVVPTGNLVTTSQNGKTLTVTGVKAGTVKIKASQTVNGVVKTETCVVYVTVPVGDVSINPSSLNIDRGGEETVQLIFTPEFPTNPKVLWGSSDTSVATVSGDSYTATIKAVKGGHATINVVTEDGLKVATCDVNVREPVTGISLNQTTVETAMSLAKYQLVATVSPSGDGVNKSVSWTSSDPSVATVDQNGLVTYVAPGYTTIIAKTDDGGYMATCNFVISIPVSNIKLDYTDEIMRVGDRLRISAEVFPLNASNRTVYYESSNTNTCIVDSNGLVEAVGTGSCTILCKSLDGNATAMCNIYVKQPVSQVVLNTTDITVRQGQVFWLNATCLPENADNKLVTWESRDEKVCKVEADGKVTAVGAGTTSVIATNTDTGLTAYCVVTVKQPVDSITLNSEYQQMWVGAKYAIIPTIEPKDAENKNVTYMSSDPSVASVDAYGVVTALKGGNTVVEVTTEDVHLVAACTIDVKEYVSSVSLSEKTKMMNEGASGTLKASVGTDTATDKSLNWSSSNNDVIRVDSNGNIFAGEAGVAVVTATAADGSGCSDSCIITVVNPVRGVSLEPDTVRLLIGDSKVISASVSPDDASIQGLTWTSSNESVATVDEAGEVFAVGSGKTKITATSQDGNNVKGVAWVYVTPVVNISSIKINSSEIYMLTGKTRKLTAMVRPAVNNDYFEWYSTDTGIVTVDQYGNISTVGPGVADVVAISNANGVSSSCTVHSLAISRSSITLGQYDSYYMDVIGIEAGDKVTWRSSNPRVCTITSSGQIIGRRPGTTTITAVSHNKTMYCTVKVISAY